MGEAKNSFICLIKIRKMEELDCTWAARGLWLVKGPKYISQRWEAVASATEGGVSEEVGRIRIVKSEQAKEQEVTLILPDKILQMDVAGKDTPSGSKAESRQSVVPKEHKFGLSRPHQNLGVFSHEYAPAKSELAVETEEEPKPFNPRLRLEGHVTRRAECRPIFSSNYMQMKKKQIENSQKPRRSVQHINTIVNTYKPVANHANLIEYENQQKNGAKKERADKNKVQEMLFSAFEKHQYYSLKDLVRITQQPIPYLKEILHELCTYNMKAPHKNMWELKTEFRHYKSDGEEKN